jgi:rhodanese-related sulfurtransferase
MEQLIEFAGNHFFLVAAFFALLALIVFNEVRRLTQGFNDVSTQEATRMLNRERAVLLDVRDDQEYGEGHIANSIHIPLKDLSTNLGKLEKHKNKPIIAYCRSGNRSATACRQLQKQGFETVYNLHGGVIAWQKDNLPLTKQ